MHVGGLAWVLHRVGWVCNSCAIACWHQCCIQCKHCTIVCWHVSCIIAFSVPNSVGTLFAMPPPDPKAPRGVAKLGRGHKILGYTLVEFMQIGTPTVLHGKTQFLYTHWYTLVHNGSKMGQKPAFWKARTGPPAHTHWCNRNTVLKSITPCMGCGPLGATGFPYRGVHPEVCMRTKSEQKALIDSCRALFLLYHPEAIHEMVPTDELLKDWPENDPQ